MKTCLLLLGAALGIVCASVRAQEAEPTPPPAPSPAPAPANEVSKPAPPVVADSPLVQKLKAAGANISSPIREIVKLSESGADASLIQAYVENSPVAYNPKAEEIIYLHDHGISNPIITAMIRHGAKVREEETATQVAMAAAQPSLPPAVASGPAIPQSGDAAYEVSPPSDMYQAYPADPGPGYAYPYPSYYYPSYTTFGVYIAPPFYYGRPYYRGGYGYYGHGGGGGHGGGDGAGHSPGTGTHPPGVATHSSHPSIGAPQSPGNAAHSSPSTTGTHR